MTANNMTNATEARGSSEFTIVIASVLGIALILEITIGNLLVMIAVWKDRTLHIIQNWFIVSLAAADFMLGLFVVPLSLVNELLGYWWFGPALCELWLHMDILLCTASILSLCVISVDRFWSVTSPITYTPQRRKSRAKFLIGLVWFLAIVVCIPSLTWWRTEKDFTVAYPACGLSTALEFIIYSTLGSFFIPLAIIVSLYIVIGIVARRTARKGLKRTALRHTESKVPLTSAGNAGSQSVPNSPEENTTSPTAPPPTIIVDEGYESKARIIESDSEHELSQPKKTTNFGMFGSAIVAASVVAGSLQPEMATDSEMELNASRHSLASVTSETGAKKFCYRKKRLKKKSKKVQRKSTVYRELLRRLRSSQSTHTPRQENPEQRRRRILKARERRATLVIGIVMVTFIGCWAPFFILYVVDTIIKRVDDTKGIPGQVFTVIFWLGYCNSGVNPVIYTVFNRDFKAAFRRLLCSR